MISCMKNTALAALTLWLSSAHAAEDGTSSTYATGVPCTPCAESLVSRSMEDCTVKVNINFFASETGTNTLYRPLNGGEKFDALLLQLTRIQFQ